MISGPDFFFDEFVAAGSDSFLVHWEGNNNLHRTVHRIKTWEIPDLDLVLVMTVNPGFGHQHFIHNTLPKLQRVRRMIE